MNLAFLQATPGQQTSINPSQLSVTSPTGYEVANSKPHHRQYLGYQFGRLQLLVNNVPSDSLTLKENENGISYRVPVEAWLRSQLDIIEHFAQQNVNLSCLDPPPKSAVYKPLWRGNSMYIHVAPWCNFLRQSFVDGVYETVSRDTQFGRGTFTVSLEVPHIYIGPHKNGENYSLSLAIVQMVFHPEVTPSPPIKEKKAEKKGRSRKEHAAQNDEFAGILH